MKPPPGHPNQPTFPSLKSPESIPLGQRQQSASQGPGQQLQGAAAVGKLRAATTLSQPTVAMRTEWAQDGQAFRLLKQCRNSGFSCVVSYVLNGVD